MDVSLGTCDMTTCEREATVSVEASSIGRDLVHLCERHYAELNRRREVAQHKPAGSEES